MWETASCFMACWASASTDVWTSSVGPMRLITLPPPLIDTGFSPEVVHLKRFLGSLANQAVVNGFDDACQTRVIPKSPDHNLL